MGIGQKIRETDKTMGFFSEELPLDKRVELLERDESDLASIKDIKEGLEQFRGDVHRDKLVQQADEESMVQQ